MLLGRSLTLVFLSSMLAYSAKMNDIQVRSDENIWTKSCHFFEISYGL
jgi:hypothetical protein